MNFVQEKHQLASGSAEQDITVHAFGPLPPTGMKIPTVVFSAHMALNTEWNHIGPLCHNPTVSHGAGEGSRHCPYVHIITFFECLKSSVGFFLCL